MLLEQNTPENVYLQFHGADLAQPKLHNNIQIFQLKDDLARIVPSSLRKHLYEIGVNSYFPKSISRLPTSIMGGGTATAPGNPIQGDAVILPMGHNGEPPLCFCPPLLGGARGRALGDGFIGLTLAPGKSRTSCRSLVFSRSYSQCQKLMCSPPEEPHHHTHSRLSSQQLALTQE